MLLVIGVLASAAADAGADSSIGTLGATALVLGGVGVLVLLRVLVWRRRWKRLNELSGRD